jgi:hypothetical protein
MNLDQCIAILQQISAAGDPSMAPVANYTLDMVRQVQSGHMDPSESAELLRDVVRQVEILENVSDLRMQEMLHTAITGLIAIASAVY